MQIPNQRVLRQTITQAFSLGELEILCFDMDIDYEVIGGGNKGAVALRLIEYCERRGQLSELIRTCRELRPDSDWAFVESADSGPKAQLTLVIDGDFGGFTEVDKSSLVSALARIVNVDPKQIQILTVTKGSVRITLELPEEAAQVLLLKFSKQDAMLEEYHIVKVEPLQLSTPPRSTRTPVLFLCADPTNVSRLRLGEEFREIQEQLQLAQLRNQFELSERMSVRPSDVSQALLDVHPQIVHFSGHGTEEGELCFENQLGQVQPVTPEALANLFHVFADTVKCVILNACYSGLQADAIAKHVEYVIGMSQAFGDRAAIAFSVGFYQALGAGRSIEEAYQLGVVQIGLQGIPGHLTPVLLSFGLKVLGVLSRSGGGGRTKRGIKKDTGLDITIVADQLDVLRRKGYVAVDQTNGVRWTITEPGKRLLESASPAGSVLG